MKEMFTKNKAAFWTSLLLLALIDVIGVIGLFAFMLTLAISVVNYCCALPTSDLYLVFVMIGIVYVSVLLGANIESISFSGRYKKWVSKNKENENF